MAIKAAGVDLGLMTQTERERERAKERQSYFYNKTTKIFEYWGSTIRVGEVTSPYVNTS